MLHTWPVSELLAAAGDQEPSQGAVQEPPLESVGSFAG